MTSQANARRPQLHFARFEFKYQLPNDLRKEFERELAHFVEFDPFVAQTPHHQYFVRSLYFDDPAYSCYFDKVEGLKKRAKFRLRTYTQTPSPQTPQFLEIKGRHNQLVFKHRTPVAYTAPDNPLPDLLSACNSSAVTQQFCFEYYRKHLKAAALIDYWRRPYISRYDPEFRLTFDAQIQASQSSGLAPELTDRTRRVLPGYTVMEVKFKRHIPAWFHRLIQAYQLTRKSISKICYGLEALELVEED